MPVAFQIASLLPSGEGIAQPKFILLSRSIGVTLPVNSTFKRVHSPVALKPVVHKPLVVSEVVKAVDHKLSPSADQSRVAIPRPARQRNVTLLGVDQREQPDRRLTLSSELLGER